MKRLDIRIKETIATLISEERYHEAALDEIRKQRARLEDYIAAHPEFREALEPLQVTEDAPEIVERMAHAAKKAGVGPMAAVAGGISQMVVERLISLGAEHVVFENGGDIVLRVAKETAVGIYTGQTETSKYAFLIRPEHGLLAICTSSGVVGHSLSFGKANAATVIAKDGFLADAAATLLGNLVKSERKEEIQNAIERVLEIEGVLGAVISIGNLWGIGGWVPQIVKADVDDTLISRG